MRKWLLAAIVLVITAEPAGAQHVSEEQLTKVKALKIVVYDDTSGGCAPDPDVLKTEAELILRRSGIKVTESLSAHPIHAMNIHANGYPVSHGLSVRSLSCVVRLDVKVWKNERLMDGTFGVVTAYENGRVLTYPKDGMPQFLRLVVNEQVTHLANEILKARGR